MWMLVLVLAAFHLMRIDGTWKITGGSYTVERTGCAPSPLRRSNHNARRVYRRARTTEPASDSDYYGRYARRTTKHLGTTTLSSTPVCPSHLTENTDFPMLIFSVLH
ncbi:MAG TPA: hypothetical protein VEK15_13355 [Vicinamibacteria bacterium]|nr:hypothetical protein [Vicinamibacteria bacterium]